MPSTSIPARGKTTAASTFTSFAPKGQSAPEIAAFDSAEAQQAAEPTDALGMTFGDWDEARMKTGLSAGRVLTPKYLSDVMGISLPRTKSALDRLAAAGTIVRLKTNSYVDLAAFSEALGSDHGGIRRRLRLEKEAAESSIGQPTI